ncbi:hypothetical protein [Bauldia sp.]|uniref:hypothetical protein n=1 Tax=Bauldia sp. TaxID=2575872 RepID=UPI003BAC8CCF
MQFLTGRRVPLAVLVAASVVLGACTTRDGGGLVDGNTDEATTLAVSDFLKSAYCPPIEIRAGTEALTVYERGNENDPAHVRYQASITKTARECTQSGETLTIKVGVSGRVLAGPKGGAGTVTLPLRIVVVKQIGGTGPLYSNLFRVPITIGAPALSADYSEVFESVSVNITPQDRNLIVYVGFDEGA